MSGDASGLPDMRYAVVPLSEIEVMKLDRYQTECKFHPYTCCNHVTMRAFSGGLRCPKCGRIQDWVLQSTLELMRGKS